jgi:hypothetical protein
MKLKYTQLNIDRIADLQQFFSTYWRKGHPLSVSEALLKWQYQGYGKKSGIDNFQLLYDDMTLVGTRGVIPGEIQIPTNKGQYNIYSNAGCSMWMMHPEYRNLKLGYKLHKIVENEFDVLISIGANKNTSAPLYRRNGYYEKKSFHRYILPLQKPYQKLLVDNVSKEEIQAWIDSIPFLQKETFNLSTNNNFNELEKIWLHSCKHQRIISQYRSADFWKWRYNDSPIYKYYIFGGITQGGIVVVRIEKAMLNTKNNIFMKVLRLIELVPYNPNTWTGFIDHKFTRLLQKVLTWGKEKNCVAADFHCSSSRLGNVLGNLGFSHQDSNIHSNLYSMAGLLQPVEYRMYDYNCYLKLDDRLYGNDFSYENTYFVRADTDQDRPNYLEKQYCNG